MLWTVLRRSYSSNTRLSISQILNEKPLGSCEVTGWVKSARKQKDITFLHVSDGSSHNNIQVILPSSKVTANLKHHSAVRVTGDLIESSHAGQNVEIAAQTVEVINSCKEPYPIQPRKHFAQNFVRKLPSIKSKTNSTASLLRLRSEMTQMVNQYFILNGYVHIHTPVLTSNDCEGGGEVFQISTKENPPVNQSINTTNQSINDTNQSIHNTNNSPISGEEKSPHYFDKPVFLTVSGQLHLEAVCNGIHKVYTFNPAFRAEKGRTRRHLSEFWMIEAEIAFVQDLSELLDIIEDLTKHVARNIINNCKDDMITYSKSAKVNDNREYIANMVDNKFSRISFYEAKNIISEHSDLPEVDDDLSRDQELFLCEYLKGPVFVINWPKSSKPFYMRECKENPKLVSCADLLVPGVGELAGASLREFDAKKLRKRCKSEDLEWYIDMRSKGSAPTAGFGMGFERLIQWLLNVDNIKDTIPFYRSSHECQL